MTIRVEVVYAEANKQKLIAIMANEGITAQQAVERSGIERFFPNIDIKHVELGIFSIPCTPDTRLCDGDRVEIYRPLLCDPKEMRRQRAHSAR